MTISGSLLWPVVTLLLGSASFTGTQQPPARPEAPASTTAAPPASGAYVIEAKRTRLRLEDDGRAARELTMRVRILDALGVRQWGQMPFAYASESDDLEIRQMEVRKADGSVVKVGPESIQELTANQQGPGPVFVDLRQKHVTVPSLQPGDTLVFTAAWITARPLAPNHAWFEYSFAKDEVVEDERLEIDVPAALTPVLRLAPGAPPEASGGRGELAADRRVFRWHTSNSKTGGRDAAAEQGEDPPEDEVVPDVRLTTFRDWRALADWLGPLLRPAPDDAVKAKAAELTKGLTDRAAKIEALYSYVATQIRYVSLSFGIGRFAPHAPGEVLKNQYGDCKDKHALLSALLASIGVDAVPVLINTSRSISEDLPSPSEFDHVITAIPSGSDPAAWTWLDATTEVAPFGMLDRSTRDRLAFSLGTPRIGHAVVRTPADPPFPSTEDMDVVGEVNPYGVLAARVRIRLRGDTELVLRSMARVIPRESLQEVGEQSAKSMGFKGEIAEFAFGDPLATKEPFEITFKLRRGGYLDWAAKSAKLEGALGGFDASVLDAQSNPLTKERKLGTPTTIRRTLQMQLPPGYRISAPANAAASVGGFQYSSHYEVKDRTLTVRREYKGQPRVLQPSQSAEYTRMARAIAADVAQTILVNRETDARAPIPADMTANELYHAGYSAYMAGSYDAALELWTRSTERDPKLANAWNGVGLASQQLKKYEDAIAAFEKQIALEPSSTRAHKDLAAVLNRTREFERAARAYRRHVELNPSDGTAFRELGEVYQSLEQHDEAIKALERAAALLRDDAWVPLLLGASFLDLNQPARATEAFDRALGMSSGPPVLTKIAWELADHGVNDARALELIARATSGIAAALASLTPADVRGEHFDLMARLAWCWDARGLIAMRRGELDLAVRYFDSAWRLGGKYLMAEHLGQAYERMKNRTSDALSAYLTARALTDAPPDSLIAHIKRLAGAADLEPLFKAAQVEFLRQRGARMKKEWPEGKAEFVAILDAHGRPVSASMQSGPESFATMAARLTSVQFPISSPDGSTTRLVARVAVACPPNGTECGAVIAPAGASVPGGQ